MIIVIQCAATKRPDAGRFKTSNGRQVKFVADPCVAPPSDFLYARPDDASDSGPSWRALLLRYNDDAPKNQFGLLRAIEMYENAAYSRLAEKFGLEKTYVLSAGWGLIAGSFLTPDYDITFSQSADRYKRRRRSDAYEDLCMLPADTAEPIFFFGGKDYVPLFVALTKSIAAPKTVFFNSAVPPDAPGCSLTRFETSTRTNWHYECANAFIKGYFR
jgi:hypothetical protein